MKAPPLSVVSKWPPANYVDPDTRGPANLIVVSVLLGVVAVILGIRLYTRIRISKGFGLDDILILLAFAPAMAFGISGVTAEYRFQWNRHTWDIEPQFAVPGLQLSLANQILFDLATSLTKLSMLALIYRLTVAGESRTRYLVIAVAVVVTGGLIVFVLVTIFQCRRISDYWTISVEPQECIDEAAHLLAAGVINTTLDFIIVILPIKTILDLRIPFRQRLLIYSLFTGGLLASTAGAVRTYFTWVMTTTPDHDVTWNAYLVILTSVLELYIGIAVASLPATKPFFSHYVPRLLGNSIWTDVTEPLAEKRKHSRKASDDSSMDFRDVESADLPVQRPAVRFVLPSAAPTSNHLSRDSQRESLQPGFAYTPYRPHEPYAAPATGLTLMSPALLSPHTPLNLNKPLPRITSGLERAALMEAILSQDSGLPPARMPPVPQQQLSEVPQQTPPSTTSVYDFQAYADGKIVVAKADRPPSSASSESYYRIG